MKILFATTEFAGYAKVGGLGDVSAALPRALRCCGIDIRILMPAYPDVLAKATDISIVAELPARAGITSCRIGEVRMPDGLTLYLVLAPSLYEREGTPYCGPEAVDWVDNDLRFARLSLAAAELAKGRIGLPWVPDLLHVNDWPGGLAPAYLRWDGARVPTVLTVHNIAYQGLYSRERANLLGVPEWAVDINGVEFHDRLSFLKAGIFYADHVSTVSPTYAHEITTEALGAGLHGLIQRIAAEGRLTGIINGVDETWNPSRDPHLPHHFDAEDFSGKRAIADLVRTGLCMTPSEGPLFGVVSRLVHQKGLDIVAETGREIVREGGQIAILGLGDPETERVLSRLARCHRDHIALLNGFNEPMARRIVAASDFCLMPSRFEPCGLVQMQAQRYGTLPIAHATGGLVDTIEDGQTGFLFSDFSGEGLHAACRRAFDVWADADAIGEMRRTAMARSFHWADTAAEYQKLYGQLTGRPTIAQWPPKVSPTATRAALSRGQIAA
jgi:starch synthase